MGTLSAADLVHKKWYRVLCRLTVMLLAAGVVISMLMGEDGAFSKLAFALVIVLWSWTRLATGAEIRRLEKRVDELTTSN